MSAEMSGVSIVWSCVTAGMGAFLLVAARRFPGRGYELLGLTMGTSALADFVSTGAASLGPGLASFLGTRAALVIGPFAVAFNLHFVLKYSSFPRLRSVLFASYVSISAVALAAAVSTFWQLPHVERLSFIDDYRSPSEVFSAYTLVVIGAHVFASWWFLLRAHLSGKRKALGVLLAFSVLAPAVVIDTSAIMLWSEKWYLTQAGVWLYSLVVLTSLLAEVEGAAGLLKETTSSLAERTAELEVSYAEIDLMHTELFQKQQLAAVGELAAAIAHEVRNPLAIIMNAVSGMKRTTISQTDRNTLLDIVNEESERLNHLVTELLRFARPVAASTGPASLLDICQRASREAPEEYQVEVATKDDAELTPVLVDPGLFRLALDNLMANSAQAMGGKGPIKLSVRSTTFADGSPAAAVDITDTGCGMRDQVLENARKPFFTTKPRGTGLGIPIVERIVDAHGGEMAIVSEVGVGTTVTIKLPAEAEVARISYPGSKHPTGRRRLRSIPPGSVRVPTDPDQEQS